VSRQRRVTRGFKVCVLGHLRPVKDPFRTALASRLLPPMSGVRVLHVGAALSPDMAKQARAEATCNPRYRWLGDLPRWRALRILAGSRLLVLTSRLEGGANVVSEAIAVGVPVLASRIAGSVGLLGSGYPGYFSFGDTHALAELLTRAETDATFYTKLKSWCRRLRPLVRPARERQSWRRLLRELAAR
jgi:glycosyltransferase involved in cell wall biosynthesis